jgi:hypothetical protein
MIPGRKPENVRPVIVEFLRPRHRHYQFEKDPDAPYLGHLTICASKAAQQGLNGDEAAAHALFDEIRTTIMELDPLNAPHQERIERRLDAAEAVLNQLEELLGISELPVLRLTHVPSPYITSGTQISRFQGDLIKLQAELHERVNEGERLRQQINSIRASICWRITWPIRWFHNQVTWTRSTLSTDVVSAEISTNSPPVVSIHFPKAGGYSLQVQFVKLLGDRVALDYTHDPLTSTGRETAEFPDGKRLVHGHFRAQRYASANAYWMTFLRHPVDNLFSIYFYWKALPKAGHALHARFLRERPSILEFATYPAMTCLMSQTYFGNFDMSRFDFIGFYENRDTDILRLAKDLGLPLAASLHENRTAETIDRRDLEANVSVRRRLTDLLAADVAFYERLRR